ncbi:ecto-ADP-ribosyltransferase 3 isoform X2 [Acomys russatus]|uniref:ecto-ADP-ribosyltransferase 3 isoform X2 n=1 Tax=Acomys russatus TaxID=60746 RepID=UPI0021E30E3A|nr:ecto-ADP-ribosyltransferase 3 isoform X2 [Acomys russatus]
MKMEHFEMVTTLLAAMLLMDAFQVKAQVADEAEYAFDDEYLKCSKRMEMKFVPQLLKEEMAESDPLRAIWDHAATSWEARKARIAQPLNFKDTYGITLMAYITEAQEKTPFYYTFNTLVKVAGRSREDYVYTFPFKAFHFYLVRALQLLRRPCEESYRNVVYSSSNISLAFNSSILPDISLTLGEQNQTRLDSYILAYSAKPPTADNQRVLTIRTCFGIAVGKFFNKEREGAVLIPLNEVFQVSRGGTANDLILQSINKTCSYFECAFLGGLRANSCLENPELDIQKLEDSVPGIKPWPPCMLDRKHAASTGLPGIQVLRPDENFHVPDQKPENKHQGNADNLSPGTVPRPKTHPSASSGHMLLPSVTASIVLTIASAVNVFIAL